MLAEGIAKLIEEVRGRGFAEQSLTLTMLHHMSRNLVRLPKQRRYDAAWIAKVLGIAQGGMATYNKVRALSVELFPSQSTVRRQLAMSRGVYDMRTIGLYENLAAKICGIFTQWGWRDPVTHKCGLLQLAFDSIAVSDRLQCIPVGRHADGAPRYMVIGLNFQRPTGTGGQRTPWCFAPIISTSEELSAMIKERGKARSLLVGVLTAPCLDSPRVPVMLIAHNSFTASDLREWLAISARAWAKHGVPVVMYAADHDSRHTPVFEALSSLATNLTIPAPTAVPSTGALASIPTPAHTGAPTPAHTSAPTSVSSAGVTTPDPTGGPTSAVAPEPTTVVVPAAVVPGPTTEGGPTAVVPPPAAPTTRAPAPAPTPAPAPASGAPAILVVGDGISCDEIDVLSLNDASHVYYFLKEAVQEAVLRAWPGEWEVTVKLGPSQLPIFICYDPLHACGLSRQQLLASNKAVLSPCGLAHAQPIREALDALYARTDQGEALRKVFAYARLTETTLNKGQSLNKKVARDLLQPAVRRLIATIACLRHESHDAGGPHQDQIDNTFSELATVMFLFVHGSLADLSFNDELTILECLQLAGCVQHLCFLWQRFIDESPQKSSKGLAGISGPLFASVMTRCQHLLLRALAWRQKWPSFPFYLQFDGSQGVEAIFRELRDILKSPSTHDRIHAHTQHACL